MAWAKTKTPGGTTKGDGVVNTRSYEQPPRCGTNQQTVLK
jgi:hypothetical protein